jgi:hypothetical protein
MQLTKQQKIYAAVLGLAVSAFAFDRFVLGPGDDAPEEVAAATAARRPAPRRTPARPAGVASVNAAAAQAAAAGPAAPGTASPSTLSIRLEALAAAQKLKLDNVGDAFKPSTVWVGSPKQVAPTVEVVDAVAEFQKKKLTAVVKQNSGGIAVIDKTYLSVGQSLDGFRLVAVKDRSAILRRGNQRVELRLRDDDAGTGTITSEKIAGTDGQ